MQYLPFFAIHFISDFLCQSRHMAQNKSKNIVVMLKHGGILFIFFALGCLIFRVSLYFALFNTLAHCLQDWYIWRMYKAARSNQIDYKYWEDKWFYTFIGIDQAFHYSTIILIMEVV